MVSKIGTNILEEPAASVFRLEEYVFALKVVPLKD
jgi:hypothetical protein